jgi:hypothetical protein
MTLTEQSASVDTFTSWGGGGRSGSTTTCTAEMTSDQNVTATFGVTPTPDNTEADPEDLGIAPCGGGEVDVTGITADGSMRGSLSTSQTSPSRS